MAEMYLWCAPSLFAFTYDVSTHSRQASNAYQLRVHTRINGRIGFSIHINKKAAKREILYYL